ncbi:VanZ family protein [Haloarcula laminariae]|uniref:VanZ family protein n=1 Tax=Haloarcula laminariae TaxID=2961577 RepID=UPI0021C8F3AD|nr:VanZ family protein [Halomicroarcula laminariae]
MDRPTRRYVPAGAFALLLLAVSLLPASETGGPTPGLFGIALDKWVHAGSYAVLTALLSRARDSRTVRAVALAAVVAVGYGGGIELLQGLVPSRGTSLADMGANAVGAVCGGGLWLVLAARVDALTERVRA